MEVSQNIVAFSEYMNFNVKMTTKATKGLKVEVQNFHMQANKKSLELSNMKFVSKAKLSMFDKS